MEDIFPQQEVRSTEAWPPQAELSSLGTPVPTTLLGAEVPIRLENSLPLHVIHIHNTDHLLEGKVDKFREAKKLSNTSSQ